MSPSDTFHPFKTLLFGGGHGDIINEKQTNFLVFPF